MREIEFEDDYGSVYLLRRGDVVGPVIDRVDVWSCRILRMGIPIEAQRGAYLGSTAMVFRTRAGLDMDGLYTALASLSEEFKPTLLTRYQALALELTDE